jgi:hypothetical protein
MVILALLLVLLARDLAVVVEVLGHLSQTVCQAVQVLSLLDMQSKGNTNG